VVASGSAASQTAVESRGYSECRCVCVIIASSAGCSCSIVPNHIDCVFGIVIGIFCLGEQSQGAWAGDIDLFGVVAWKNEDVVWDCVVGN